MGILRSRDNKILANMDLFFLPHFFFFFAWITLFIKSAKHNEKQGVKMAMVLIGPCYQNPGVHYLHKSSLSLLHQLSLLEIQIFFKLRYH